MTMLKSYQVAFVFALLLPLAYPGSADARPTSSGGFRSGFSSQRASVPMAAPKPPYSSAKSGGSFGSFGRRPSSSPSSSPSLAPAPAQPSAPARSSGGFGSFGANSGTTAAPRKSDSALSQQLNRNTSEANALRTLDARRQMQADAARDTRPVPGYGQGASGQAAPTYAPPPVSPQPQAPIIVRQDSGLGHVIAGAVLANMARGAHAHNNGYPGAYPSTGGGMAPARAGGTSFLGLFATLCVLALVAWAVYFAWRRLRRGREAKKANYSFERN